MQLKYIILLCVLFVLTNPVSQAMDTSNQSHDDWLKSLPKPWQIEQTKFACILPEFHRRFPDYKERLRAIATWRLGTPYKIFNLGEEQAPDPDPIFRLDVSDCTSHILTSMTLAETHNWHEAREHIIALHYKPMASGEKLALYNKRWHYTSDRIMNHASTPEITHHYVTSDEMKSADVTLNKKANGAEFLELDWSLPVTVNYLPSEHITAEFLAKIPDFVGIAFVKESYFKMGVVMAHEGMLLDGKQLLHAGQVANKTVSEDFLSYYFTDGGARFDGIMLFDFMPLKN